MNNQEVENVSSLFRGANQEERRDLFNTMPNKILHKYYCCHTIPKHGGGTRNIYEPNKRLKRIQKRIYRGVLQGIPVSKYAFAYVPGRSILDNAKPHVGNPILLKLDIHRFFDNIHFRFVFEIIMNAGYSKEFSRLIAGLITVDDFLPQGAPTSPAISNIYLKEFDEKIGKYCKDNGIVYTRYSDDLTFSMKAFDRHLITMVREELEKLGLELNRKKSRVISGPLQKRVTGVVVNEKAQAPKAYKRKIRQEMYYITRFGLDKHLKRTKESLNRVEYVNHLLGRINYVLQLERGNEEFKKYRDTLLALTLNTMQSQLKELLS